VCEALAAVWAATNSQSLVSSELSSLSISLVAELQKTLADLREGGLVDAETISELNDNFDQGRSMVSTNPGSAIAVLLTVAERIYKLDRSIR